ncbi:M48 family metallopeptidase [Laribacter hongkongensis]|uniref:M48 family metallopeptidase n=1 Tax=Laribacter hongkongensis TaxID=168471 RepID=UPI001EFD9009|nr:SprT family zinc-dependent metalloprotease [Laribacter hongkongensis]MCG9031187.1 M48 family metallopeptidase [Laribacter hongkongensis]MCG9092508.1 M48 family metallopeptidase [Laribacter hongkongensis]
MPILLYGQTAIEWRFQPDDSLKRHYITVERGQSVLLRGPSVGLPEQEALVRQRARWIRQKQAQVDQPLLSDDIVTGSRLHYAGRNYFTEVRHEPGLPRPRLSFTASRFVIEHPHGTAISTEDVAPLLLAFYRERAQERLQARVRHWERKSGLKAQGVSVKIFQSRWACCDAANLLTFHPRVMALPASVLDYIIIHELCHTIEKNHTKAFWILVGTHIKNWRQQHEFLEQTLFKDIL